jgi:hypothetical protein
MVSGDARFGFCGRGLTEMAMASKNVYSLKHASSQAYHTQTPGRVLRVSGVVSSGGRDHRCMLQRRL